MPTRAFTSFIDGRLVRVARILLGFIPGFLGVLRRMERIRQIARDGRNGIRPLQDVIEDIRAEARRLCRETVTLEREMETAINLLI
jgi:hypothetical protein